MSPTKAQTWNIRLLELRSQRSDAGGCCREATRILERTEQKMDQGTVYPVLMNMGVRHLRKRPLKNDVFAGNNFRGSMLDFSGDTMITKFYSSNQTWSLIRRSPRFRTISLFFSSLLGDDVWNWWHVAGIRLKPTTNKEEIN